MKIDLAVASHSMSVWSSLQHLVTPTGVTDQEQQEHRVQDPDGFASLRPKEKEGVHEIDDPTEDEQGNSPFRIGKSGRDESKESRRKHVDQCPKADIDREQRRGTGGGVQDDSNSKRNSRNFRHGLFPRNTASNRSDFTGSAGLPWPRVLSSFVPKRAGKNPVSATAFCHRFQSAHLEIRSSAVNASRLLTSGAVH